jgi:uncharacterized protein
MSPRRLILHACWILLFAFLAFSVFAGIEAFEFAVHPPRKPVVHAQLARAVAVRQRATLADVEITASDGARLRGWFAQPARSNHSVVLLFHGVADNREGMGGFGEMFLAEGYSVLLMDSRAHGESGGLLATYGVLEGGDVHQWVEWLEQNMKPSCVFGLGESMGAALLLQSLTAEPRFCAVVAESPFQSFREIALERAAQVTHTNSYLARLIAAPAIAAGFVYAHLRYGVDFSEASPEDAVAATRVPVLLIHGSNDDNIPPRHSIAIKARNPNMVSLWIVPGAVHTGASSTAPQEFRRRVLEWFSRSAKATVSSRT